MEDGELKDLFDLRKKYESDLDEIFNPKGDRNRLLRKSSSKNLSRQNSKKSMIKVNSEKVLGRVSLNVKRKLEATVNTAVISGSLVSSGKYKKNRIYYE